MDCELSPPPRALAIYFEGKNERKNTHITCKNHLIALSGNRNTLVCYTCLNFILNIDNNGFISVQWETCMSGNTLLKQKGKTELTECENPHLLALLKLWKYINKDRYTFKNTSYNFVLVQQCHSMLHIPCKYRILIRTSYYQCKEKT